MLLVLLVFIFVRRHRSPRHVSWGEASISMPLGSWRSEARGRGQLGVQDNKIMLLMTIILILKKSYRSY